MISVVVYGRNDSHGYNPHKRAALSLNCIAALLDDPDDEILFVDYNTPDDLPTFPEAIRDTLTPRARRLLRVLRVRPAQHRRFAARSHLQVLEPVARNVALRRANPANRWVLSTNSDMIFVPEDGASLSALAAALPDGFYHLPRFELPETLWEMLDRRDPAATIATVRAWGRRYHLDEVVTMNQPAIRFDGPGDFQLMPRAALHAIAGFDERMLLGWHVDSNIAVRMALLFGPPGDLVGRLRGYHCDHTRQVTAAHRPGAVQNDWHGFVDAVADPVAPGQPDWGLGDTAMEEVRLDTDAAYLAALDRAVAAPMDRAVAAPMDRAVAVVAMDSGAAGDPDHLAPFLIDALCTAPAGCVVAWFSTGSALLDRVAPALAPGIAVRRAAHETADLLVFEFDPAAPQPVAATFRQAVSHERARIAAGQAPRRFVTVNAINNALAPVVAAAIGAAQAPFSTRLRQGHVQPLAPPPQPGPIGMRTAAGIAVPRGRRGQAVAAACGDLAPGRWTARMAFAPMRGFPPAIGPVKLVAERDGCRLAQRVVLVHGLGRQRLSLDFTVPDDGAVRTVVLRLHTIGLAGGTVAGVSLEQRLAASPRSR
jgi:hypothetical protein